MAVLVSVLTALIVFFLLTLSPICYAAEPTPGWTKVAQSSDGTSVWYAKNHSLRYVLTKAGTPASVLTFQMISNGTVHLIDNYVTADSCLSGRGSIVSVKLSGEFLGEYDYVKDGSSIASNLADIICNITKKDIAQTNAGKEAKSLRSSL